MEHSQTSAKTSNVCIPDPGSADSGLHTKSDFVQVATDEVNVLSSHGHPFLFLFLDHIWACDDSDQLSRQVSVFGPSKDNIYKVLMVPSTGSLFHWIKSAAVNGWNRPTHHNMLSIIISIPLKRRLLPLIYWLILIVLHWFWERIEVHKLRC